MRLLVFGHNDWWVWREQGFCTRNAALVRELARRPDVAAVAVVDTPRWRGHSHRPADRRADELTPVDDGVVAVRWSYPLPLPGTSPTARRLNEALTGPGLRARLTRWMGPDEAGGPLVVLVADPRLVRIALEIPRDVLVVDVIDDWRAHAWAGRAAVDEGYALAAAHADLVTGVSRAALDQVGLPRGHVVPNAVDPLAWTPRPRPDRLTDLDRPVAGYVGVLQERFDAALLCDVARRLPEVTFALAGPLLHGVPPGLEAAPANVRLVGPLQRPAVPGWLSALDVALVPHRRDALTASMDPLKLYEYLAAGRPVVSTVAAPNPDLQPFVRVAADGADFAAALADELDRDDEERRDRRRAAVAPLTWPRRADELLVLIRRAVAARGIDTGEVATSRRPDGSVATVKTAS